MQLADRHKYLTDYVIPGSICNRQMDDSRRMQYDVDNTDIQIFELNRYEMMMHSTQSAAFSLVRGKYVESSFPFPYELLMGCWPRTVPIFPFATSDLTET